MLEEERRPEMPRVLEENRGLALGTIIASALAAGVIAYAVRRAQQPEELPPTDVAGRALERAREMVGEDRLEAGREFVTERLLPEFKPALLAMLKDFEDLTDQWFRQLEKNIKRL